jgi:pimeloyl-ACP methyl ester carboxylesterase
MPYVTVDGLRLFYKDVGRGKRTLILVPGLGSDSRVYNGLLPELRWRFRAIAPDPRGLGRSGDAPEPLTGCRLAEDLRGLMDHLAIPRAALLGTSLGALVVQRFAALYPERADRLILCAAGVGDAPYARRVRRLLLALAQHASPEELIGHLYTLILSPKFIDGNEEMIRGMEQLMAPDPRTLRTMKRQLALLTHEAEEAIGPIPCPVLILAGAEDRLVPPAYAQALHRSLPNSTLEILEDAAHHPFLETPEAATAALMDFLDERR